MKRTMLAVSGKICSGKSTLARALADALPQFRVQPLADELKNDLAAMCQVSREHMEANKERYRLLMQVYGTDVMRAEHGEDYWVVRLLDKITEFNILDAIVDDVRFPNELYGLWENIENYLSIRINITQEEQERRYLAKFGTPLTEAKRMHPSETALDDYVHEFDLQLEATMPTETQVRVVLEEMRLRGLIEGAA